jgi:hypothetical protein
VRRVDSYEMGASASLDDPQQSARELAHRTFGDEAAERLIDPVMRLVSGSARAKRRR